VAAACAVGGLGNRLDAGRHGGRRRDYATSYLVSAAVQLVALPLIFLSRLEKSPSDPVTDELQLAEPVSTAEPTQAARFSNADQPEARLSEKNGSSR
jgi:hypothetical protein